MNSAPDHSLNMLVRKLESVAPLSHDERQAIQSLPVMTRILQPGQDIVRDGGQPSQCCLVLDGWTARYKLLSEGRRQILSFHIPGDIPDLQSLHLAVMDHSLCSMTVSTVAFIPHESLRDLTARFPGLAAALWRDTLIDAAIFREWMIGIGRKSAHGRIAHLFCEMYLKLHAVGLADHHRMPWPLTQIDIGDALGLSNVHVNRVLQNLRNQKLIILDRRNLTMGDWEGLSEMGEFDPVYLHLERRAAA
ncbi:Crp/Fnr family transcriptional regulator [Methylobacterium soli]|uniref:Crp/Fnr family transcriptional regulator n=1 Tax=Methylobacterium soli TaxID=553447 RepID=A0A6L3T203_9HYPH|nr:Crp/Fnr family transcriptional regulator [Methylobacterium soli]KAB1080591.1 Crp/Fnr family transcriptional regulator [Methylobacterium soli]